MFKYHTYNMKETTKIAGCSYRQLGYWCKKGVFGRRFQAYGSGHQKEFYPPDLEIVMVLTKLSKIIKAATNNSGGVSIKLMKQVAKWMHDNPNTTDICLVMNERGKFSITRGPFGPYYIKIARPRIAISRL